MSFASEIIKPASRKIILVEIDIPVDIEQTDLFLNYEPGIWVVTLAPGTVTVTDDYDVTGYYANTYDPPLDIGSVRWQGGVLTEVASIAALHLQEDSFYYDSTTTKLYVRFEQYKQPVGELDIKMLFIGEINGFCSSTGSSNGAYFNGKYYEPRIKAVSQLSRSQGRLFDGKFVMPSGGITFDNHDGFFDVYNEYTIFKQESRVKYGINDLAFADYYLAMTAHIEKYSLSWTDFQISLADKRSKLQKKIPARVFTKSEYPNLPDNLIGKPKPVAWGDIIKAPLQCVNDVDGQTYYHFFIADNYYNDLTSVSAVYVDGAVLATGEYTVNLSNCTISILASVCSERTKVTADFRGADMDNSIDIAEDIIAIYGDLTFTSTNYDEIEWTNAKTGTPDIALYISDESTPLKQIENIFGSTNAAFIVKDDGRFTARYYDETRTVAATISDEDWIGEPKIEIDESEFLSSCVVTYANNISDKTSSRYENLDYVNEVTERYKTRASKEFQTLIKDQAGAIIKSEAIMAISKRIGRDIIRSVSIKYYALEIMDFIIGDPGKRYSDTANPGIYEIKGLKKDLQKGIIELNLRETFIPLPT